MKFFHPYFEFVTRESMQELAYHLQQFSSNFTSFFIGKAIKKIYFPFPFAIIITCTHNQQDISLLLSSNRHLPAITCISPQGIQILQSFENKIQRSRINLPTPFQNESISLIKDRARFQSLTIQYPYFHFSLSNNTNFFVSFDKHPRICTYDQLGNFVSCGSTIPFSFEYRPKIVSTPFFIEETTLQACKAHYYSKIYKTTTASLKNKIEKALLKKKSVEEKREKIPDEIHAANQKIVLLNTLWDKRLPSQEHYFIPQELSGLPDTTLYIPHNTTLQEEISKTATLLRTLKRRKTGISQEVEQIKKSIDAFLLLQDKLAAYTQEDILAGKFLGCIQNKTLVNAQVDKQASLQKHKNEQKHPHIRKFLAENGDIILAGKNAFANEILTLQIAKKDDYWFHVDKSSSAHGPHVILKQKQPKHPPSQHSILLAASVAAWFQMPTAKRVSSDVVCSQYVEVIYTQRKHIFKRKGMKKGEVCVKNAKRVYLQPSKKEIDVARLRAEEDGQIHNKGI